MSQHKDGQDDKNSSSSSRLRRKKKSKPPSAQTEQDDASSTTSSSLEPSVDSSTSFEPLREPDDQAASNFRKKRDSASSMSSTEHAGNLSSRSAPLLTAAAQGNGAKSNYADDLNNSKGFIDLSEAGIVNSANLWIKDVMSKSNNSKSGRRGSRSGQPRAKTQRRGSNSIRSMGSQSVSRSSNGSISIHTMASSMDSGTDSDLDYEILSDDGSDNNYDQDQEYLTESESDISEYEAMYRKKVEHDKTRLSKKIGNASSPSSSTDPKDLPHNTADPSERMEDMKTSSSPTLVVETSTTKSPAKELRFASQEEPQTNGSTTSPMEIDDANEKNNVVGGILRNSYTSNNSRSKIATRYLEESNVPGDQAAYDAKTAKRQVLWAEKLKEEYSHRSMNSIRKERMSQESQEDYEMPLKKMPPPSLKKSNTDAFFEMMQEGQDVIMNANDDRRGSFSSESLATLNSLNSSNRQDSLSDIESFLLLQTPKRTSLNASIISQTSSNLIDSGHDSRIVELTSRSLSNHQNSENDYIEVTLSEDKNGGIDWEKVNRGLNSRSQETFNVSAMERGQRFSHSETDAELSEDFYDVFFAPREEDNKPGSGGILAKVPQKKKRHSGEEVVTTNGRKNSIQDSVFEYSFSQSFNHPVEPELSPKAEKSSPSSSDRMRRYIVMGVCAALVVLSIIVLLSFFVRSDKIDENNSMEIDPLFLVDP